MAAKRHDDGRVCLCDRPDGTCAGLAVRRLSRDRVRELAEEIWTASSGDLLPVCARGDPRAGRAGASAQAAYRRRRAQEREAWRPGWVWRAWVVGGAATAAGLLLGATVGVWLGWQTTLLVAALAWWRLRFRPSAGARVWQRQAGMQQRTAGLLRPLEAEGWLLLHDITLPGWPDSLDHLVVGPTGVWVVESWQRRRRLGGGEAPTGTLRGLRWQTDAIAEVLDGWASVPVRPLLCIHGAWSRTPPPLTGVQVAAPRQLAQVVCSSPPLAPAEVERATARLLEVLQPAA